jgi:transcriptional regulator with XRE-family HTH domain
MEECLAFNVYVRQRRLELGLTQKELSQKLGLKHGGTISRVESGARRLPLDLIPDLANALRLDGTELCRIFLETTVPNFNQALFAQAAKRPGTFERSTDRPESCMPMFTAMIVAQTRESLLGEII